MVAARTREKTERYRMHFDEGSGGVLQYLRGLAPPPGPVVWHDVSYDVGMPPRTFLRFRLGSNENFWQMGRHRPLWPLSEMGQG